MAIDPKKTTIGQVVDNPQLKQEFEAYINNSLYGQPTKPATLRRRVTSTAPSTMSVEEAERIMASVPKGTPVSDIVKNPVYAEAFRVHMNHGFTPTGRNAQPSSTSRVNKSVADLTEDEFQQSIDEAISIVNKHREDIRTQQKASARTGATVVSSLGKTTPDGRYTPAHTPKPVSELSQEEFDRSIAEAMAIANKRRDDLRSQQELSDRLNIPVQAGKHGATVTPQGRPMKKGEVVMQVQSRAPKSQTSFDAIKSHAEHGRVTTDHVALASGMRSAMRRAYNESETNASLGTTEGIYYTKPITDAEYAKYMDYLTKAMERGDVEALKKLQKHLYLEHGIKIRRPAMHTQPVENRQVVSNQAPERPREPVTHTVKDNGREFVFRPTPKQVVQGISVVLLVSMLAAGIAQCNASDKSPNTPTTGTNIGTTYNPVDTAPTETTVPNYTTAPDVTDETTITPAPMPELANADIKTLVLDMQDSITMSSKGAVELSYAVVNEMAELCALANENVPDALNMPTLVALMFTENAFRTTEPNASPSDQWVGATQVGIDAINQQMVRAEKFYNTCMKKINQETDPTVRASKVKALESNYFIQNLYLSGASAQEIFNRCKTDAKLAAMVAGSSLLDYEWRYDGSMSKLSGDVATLRVVGMYNAGEGHVTNSESAGVIKYGWYEHDSATGKDVATMMELHLDEYPTQADMKDADRVAYFYNKFGLKDPYKKGKTAVLKEFLSKGNEMRSYMAKVGSGAEIVAYHVQNGTIDRIYSALDANNTKIGANENRNPANFNHYVALDNLGGSDGYVTVDTAGFEKYVIGQGQKTQINLDQDYEY